MTQFPTTIDNGMDEQRKNNTPQNNAESDTGKDQKKLIKNINDTFNQDDTNTKDMRTNYNDKLQKNKRITNTNVTKN